MIKQRIIFIVFVLLFTTIGISQDQTQQKVKSNANDRASIDELKRKIESAYKNLLIKISEIKRETNQQMDSILIKNSSLKIQFETSYQDLTNQILEIDKEINSMIKKIDAQNYSFRKELERLSKNQNAIKAQLLSNNELLETKIYSLRKAYETLKIDINDLNDNTSQEMTVIKKDVLNKFLLTGSSILFLALLTIFAVVFLQKRLKKVNLLEESVRLDAKMSELLENQLVMMKKESVEMGAQKTDEEIDHSLAIRVGSEIFRMRKRIENMNKDIKGINSLKNALTRLEDEFNQQGYSINDLTGQNYVDGLTAKVINAIEREDLEPGTQIISRMITPQVYYKGTAVSHGEIELAVSAKNKKESEKEGK